MASDNLFLRISDTTVVAIDTINRIETTSAEDAEVPTCCVHFPHGTEDYSGDEAQAFIDLAATAPAAAPKAKKHAVHAHAK